MLLLRHNKGNATMQRRYYFNIRYNIKKHKKQIAGGQRL